MNIIGYLNICIELLDYLKTFLFVPQRMAETLNMCIIKAQMATDLSFTIFSLCSFWSVYHVFLKPLDSFFYESLTH